MRSKILIVEDDPGDLYLVQHSLQDARQADFDLISAKRLTEGLEALDSSEFDLILLDLNLPDSSGISTVKSVRAKDSDTPIVIMTGDDDPALSAKAIFAGAQEFIIKGEMPPDALVDKIIYVVQSFTHEKPTQAG